MRVAGVDPAACDESAIGFRLAPRINAAGRLGHPEAALSLLLSDEFAKIYPRSASHFRRLLTHPAFVPDVTGYLEKIERSSARIK
jgi:single-stranded DNA-specific DHH superfamily exonuclease